jgi:mono/diheme cytochrome c family protein
MMRRAQLTPLLLSLVTTAGAPLYAADASMPFSAPGGSRQGSFTESDGRVIYERLCQGCHMADGAGAKAGPSMYPSLVANPKFAGWC